jgi:hypothetical protein
MSTRKIHDEFEAPQHTERVGSTGSSDGPRPYVTELIHLHDIEPRGPAMLRWEQKRHSHARWFVECLAEAVGVAHPDLGSAVSRDCAQTGTFIYSFAGGAAAAAYILGTLAGAPIGCEWIVHTLFQDERLMDRSSVHRRRGVLGWDHPGPHYLLGHVGRAHQPVYHDHDDGLPQVPRRARAPVRRCLVFTWERVLSIGAGSSWLRSSGRTLRLGASTSSIGRCFWYDL